MVRTTTPKTINLLGGELCLDFANSIDWDDGGAPRPATTDALRDADDVVAWGRRLGVLARTGAVSIEPRELDRAVALRDAVRAVFVAAVEGRAADPRALEQLRRTYAEASAAAHLEHADGAWRMAWNRRNARSVRFAVAASAVALLSDHDRLRRVRICPGHDCGWLFLDTSGRRRWCSMQVCGSREKMRRLYQRQRAAAGTG